MELNKIYNEDCLQTMAQMPDGFVDLTMADFPYGINEEYNVYSDSRENLISLVNVVMPEILRVSKIAFITCGIANIGLYPPLHGLWHG